MIFIWYQIRLSSVNVFDERNEIQIFEIKNTNLSLEGTRRETTLNESKLKLQEVYSNSYDDWLTIFLKHFIKSHLTLFKENDDIFEFQEDEKQPDLLKIKMIKSNLSNLNQYLKIN